MPDYLLLPLPKPHISTPPLNDLLPQPTPSPVTLVEPPVHPALKIAGQRHRNRVAHGPAARARVTHSSALLHKLHINMGHLNMADTVAIAEQMGYKLTAADRLHHCLDCLRWKRRRRNISKHSPLARPRATRYGERIYMDTLFWDGPKSISGCKHAILFMDDFTRGTYVVESKTKLRLSLS